MKRFALLLLVCGLAAPLVRAQDANTGKTGAQAKEEAGADEGMDGWKWANFILLAGVLAYLGVKFGAPYFSRETQSINQGLNEARQRRSEAERRSADVQKRLANLHADIEGFRKTALAEQEAHAAEIRRRAEQEMDRIHMNAEQHIESVGKHARLNLQREASKLALELAEQRLRQQMNPDTQKQLAGQFVESLRA